MQKISKEQERKKKRQQAGARYADYSMILVVLFLLAIGLIMLYSTSSYEAALEHEDGAYYLKRQLLFTLIGLVFYFVNSSTASFGNIGTDTRVIAMAVIAMVLEVAIIALGQKMKEAEVQTDSAIARIHSYFQPVLRAFNDSTRILVERLRREAKERMRPTPDVPGHQLLQTIAAQYPGKAVFFDLWATWCGPCMNGIQAMEPMKATLKGRDVVFVYITNESSPLDQWSEQVLRIPGQHYRIPSALWSKIPGLNGIPQYYLYDRSGHRVWEQTGFSNEVLEDIKQKLNKVLKDE